MVEFLAQYEIQVLVLFVPALGAEEKHVKPAMRFLQGENVHYYWSPDKTVMRSFGKSLGQDIELFDYWAIYPPGQLWTAVEPPAPIFWQHQMAGLPTEKKLEIDDFNSVLLSLAKEY